MFGVIISFIEEKSMQWVHRPWEFRTTYPPSQLGIIRTSPHPTTITMSDLDDEILELAGAGEKKRKKSHNSKSNKRRKEE